MADPNFEVERNAKLDNVAKPLLRTNPKITTNAKLVVSSKDDVYLESINATDDLASIDYKKFPVSPKGSYAYDLTRFYSKNNTPLEIAFATKRRDSDFSVYEEYEKQIEEDYHYGTSFNYSKLYEEDFRIFAPIQVDLNMPKKFVVYRVKDPKPNIDITDTSEGNLERIKSLISNSDIVKVFDLTKESNIGKYLRNYVQDQSFPKAPITFSFEENQKTTFNGIDLVKGGFAQKAEYLHKDFVFKDKPMIDANNFITDGFRRNNVAAGNIINLEFLFDDQTSPTYSINRYVGLYVDDIETGSGLVSSVDNGKIKFKSISSDMSLSSNLSYGAIPSYKMLNEMPILAYTRAGNNYYRIDNTKSYDNSRLEMNAVDPLNNIPEQLGIKYKGESVDTKKNVDRGFDFIKFKIIDRPELNNRIALINVKKESYKFTFIKFVANVNVEITDGDNNTLSFNTGADQASAVANLEAAYSNPGSISNVYSLETSTVNGRTSFTLTEKSSNLLNLTPSVTASNGNVLSKTVLYTNVEIPNKSYYAASPDESSSEYLPRGTFNGQYFSAAGNTTDIAMALAKLIQDRGDFNAFNIGPEVYVSIKISGYKLLQHALLVDTNNSVDFLEPEGSNEDLKNELELSSIATQKWLPYFFKGGHLSNKSILVNKETASVLNIGDYLPTEYKDRYNEVIDIVENIEAPKGEYVKAILRLENSINDNDVRVFAERRLVMGLFSAYPIHDMDFDLHDESNSDLKELKHERADQIIYEPYQDLDGSSGTSGTSGQLSQDDVLSAEYRDNPERYFANLQPLLREETVSDATPEPISSEYDRLKENETKEFSVGSRVVPNINKWVLKNGITTRDEPYHLNAYSAFGRTNFAPDLEVTERDKSAFTHEWFYIENLPDYLRFWQINDTFSYVNFIEGFELNKDLFKRVDRDYFDMFMVGEGYEVEFNKTNPKERDRENFDTNAFIKSNIHRKYTLIDNGSSETFANTIFKGLNVVFKKRKEFGRKNAEEFIKDAEFNGYKFSTLLKVNNDVESSSVEYDFIQNKRFKFIIFYITLNINDVFVDGLNRKLLYELKHQLVYNDVDEKYQYADITVSGALDLKSVNFVGEGPYKVKGIAASDGSQPNFKRQIIKSNSGTYNKLKIDLGSIGIYEVDIFSVESSNEILIEGIPTDTSTGDELDTVGLNIVDLKRANYEYIQGGFNLYAKLLKELSAGNVAQLLNKDNDQVRYTTVERDGTINNNRFTVNLLDGKEIIKKVDLGITEDLKKPKSYKLSKDIIGYKIVQNQEYFSFMHRHSGQYTIDTEPVVTFTDIYSHFKSNRDPSTTDSLIEGFKVDLYKHSLDPTETDEINIAKAYYNKFNRCGVAFNVGFIKDSEQLGLVDNDAIKPLAGAHDFNWGKIKNHYYHKVNEIKPNGVLKLTKSDEFLPVYPAIDEIAIDYKDVNVFKSSWENNYYTRSLSGGDNIQVPGTFDTAEERSYLGSTVMKLDDVYFLTQFTTQKVESEEQLDNILRNSNNESDVVFYEDSNTLLADFYMNDIIFKELSSLGALDTLKRFVEPENSIGDKTTLVDDIRDYVDKNLVQSFALDQVEIFVDKFKGSNSKISSTNNVDLIDSGGYVQDRSFTYNLHGNLPLNFRLIYNKRLGYSYEIRPMIKIQS